MHFTTTEKESVLHIQFHSPESANALSLKAARELRTLVRRHKKWPGPVLVKSGHARVFCSGGNLKDYAKLKSKAEGLKINRKITACLEDFGRWPALKIAVVDGDVLGGGMEWLARFDWRVSSPRAVLAFWQRRIGLSPGWGGGAWWARRIGEDQLRRLLLAARPLPAAFALREGLIDRVVPQWRLNEEVDQMARDLHSASARALAAWTAKTEVKVFSSLWMAEEHAAILKNWR